MNRQEFEAQCPCLWEMVKILAADTNMPLRNTFDIDPVWVPSNDDHHYWRGSPATLPHSIQLSWIENQASKLSASERFTVAAGDYDETKAILSGNKFYSLDMFLASVFEGDLNKVFIGD